ncbi:MAG: ATP-dependent helicase HrpB, partial [Hyphomicrobiaceae bacterium]
MRNALASLPISEVLDTVARTLGERTTAVLVAPPGAGKTTGVPPALLDANWLGGGRIILLEPRRLAARGAAERMAQMLGEKVGDTVGIRARLDTRVSNRTRIEVVTEGVFTRMILDDPALEGVGLVVFDEFHERSLDADFGLALALDAQTGLREDLRVLVMSATLDGARVGALMGDAPVIHAKGRAYPVATRYVGRPAGGMGHADAVASTIARALSEETGSILAFLPGQGEIRRAESQLRDRIGDRAIDIVVLHGGLDRAAQRAAIAPAPDGRRKIVLATAIAQTSLTIEGVRVVVDSGLERLPRYDAGAGVTRLETVRVSRATAEQRQGRAGRTEPGVCYRLWSEPETQGLLPFTPPEMLSADLSGLLLDCAAWGVTSPETLAWLDPPPAGALAAARADLRALGAIEETGTLTALGRQIRELPLAPRLAAMVIKAAEAGDAAARQAADIASIFSERGVGGTSFDLDDRLTALSRDRNPRARALRQLADGWAGQAIRGRKANRTQALSPDDGQPSAAALLALAFPDRIAMARGKRGNFLMANGRAAQVDEISPLSSAGFLVVGELSGSAASARILLAARLDERELERIAGDRIETHLSVTFDESAGGLRARAERRLGAMVLARETRPVPPSDASAQALAEGAARMGLDKLKWSAAQRQLRQRVAFVRNAALVASPGAESEWPDLSDDALAATVSTWLAPFIGGLTRLGDIGADRLGNALDVLLPWALRQKLDASAPTHFVAPTGQ